MKKIVFILFLVCAFVGATVEKSNAAVLKSDPPERTYYCGYFEWGGSSGLPAGTYQVLSNPSNPSQVLYIYDQLNDITYNCYSSTYDSSNNMAYINTGAEVIVAGLYF